VTSDTVNIKGLSDLAKALATLPVKIERNIMRGALRAGMKPIRDDARRLAAKQHGALAKGLKVSTDSRRKIVYSKLRTTGKHGYIAHFIEFGTARHWISSKKGKKLRIAGTNNTGRPFVVYKEAVNHPGSRPIPFMRPSLDANSETAVLAVANYIRNRLTKEGVNVPDAGDEA